MSARSIDELRIAYATGVTHPRAVVADIHARAADTRAFNAWIRMLDEAELATHLARIDRMPKDAPLWGVPFAIKDNIDLAGVPTTAGCPEYEYTPAASAVIVDQLLDAGALPIGKTNMDQFATGLVGTRSPYGPTLNAIDPDYISGGSSSGSAVAVKLGLATFALGTDTAGSGRVPAAFNGLVGVKPSCGWWSTRGIVPACRSLDCPSVFAGSVADARAVASVLDRRDADDPFARQHNRAGFDADSPRVGVLDPDQIPFYGDDDYRRLYRNAVARLPGPPLTVDASPLLEAARLLYDGPWVAERYAALEAFMADHGGDMVPVTRTIIETGALPIAADYFRASYRLAEVKRIAETMFERIDVLVMPTAPTLYTQAAVAADPLETNRRLGTYTNFVNLLDLCAVAVPAGSTDGGLPFGVTLVAPAGRDYALMDFAARWLGERPAVNEAAGDTEFRLAVCGAHLEGQPLNGDLRRRGGYRVAATRTAGCYRLYALPDGRRPALIRDADRGAEIEVEVWALPEQAVGGFVKTVAPPLGIGSVELDDGSWVNGFIAEPVAMQGATDITESGGWRGYLARPA